MDIKLKYALDFFLFLFLCSSTELFAQESQNTSGGMANGNGGTISYSIGQVVYTTNSGNKGEMFQGVQQPYEISVINDINDLEEISLSIIVYPNPTSDLLILKLEDHDNLGFNSYKYEFYDINGKLINAYRIFDSITSINMTNLVAATYILKVFKNQKNMKTFKIIKN